MKHEDIFPGELEALQQRSGKNDSAGQVEPSETHGAATSDRTADLYEAAPHQARRLDKNCGGTQVAQMHDVVMANLAVPPWRPELTL